MSIKKVDTEELVKSIADEFDAHMRVNWTGPGLCRRIKETIDSHTPVEENIVRPGDEVHINGDKQNNRVVITQKAVSRQCSDEPGGDFPVLSIQKGIVQGAYYANLRNFSTPDGKPVTGYEDD